MVIVLTRGDMGFDLLFQLVQSDGKTPVDISTATVVFKMMPGGGSSCKIDKTCTITDGPNGKCKYTIQSGDLDTVGLYQAELQATFSSSKRLTADLDNIEVKADLPA
jgi:hypothetical protein